MTLHSEQDAIKQAVEAGYDLRGWEPKYDGGDDFSSVLLDPAFWQALGKARDWVEIPNQSGGAGFRMRAERLGMTKREIVASLSLAMMEQLSIHDLGREIRIQIKDIKLP